MARLPFVRFRWRPAVAGRLTGRLTRALAATVAAVAAAALPALAGTAQAQPVTPGGPARVPVTFAVTSMSPSFAKPGQTITISGLVRNVSRTAMRGLSVQLWSSSAFTSRSALGSYWAGSSVLPQSPVSVAPVTIARLAAKATRHWTIRVPVRVLQLTCFGVYPLTAQVDDASGVALASEPALLPYWPGNSGLCSSQAPKPADISWIWPLLDTPHQGACPGLTDNSLAASIARGGRLSNLLAVGRQYAASARLTWAIDPALLDNLRTMTTPYEVGGSASCGGAQQQPASPQATTWLRALSQATAGQPVFATPYADVDVAALSQHSRTADLSRAFAEGQRVAGQILRRHFAPGPASAGGTTLADVAWPADGIANLAVLENLAAVKISTVILNSTTMPASPSLTYTPSAVTSTLDGVGTEMHVLLADATISALLGSPDAASRQPSAIFRVRQLYLAETAMIVAEAPTIPRAIVVAPPRRWDPSDQLARDLLADTVSAPWLKPASAGQLLELPPDHVFHSPPQTVSPAELPRRLLGRVAGLDRKVGLLESIRTPGSPPDLQLYRAVFGVESSAWRGGGAAARQAQTLLSRTSQFVADQLSMLSVSGNGQVTLGGTVSNVNVSIGNGLGYRVRVRLAVSASNPSVQISMPDNGIFTVPPGVRVIKLPVHATSGGSATIRLSLTSPEGVPLPVKALSMHIRATEFGALALLICAAALAVFVFTSAGRAIRHGRPGPPAQPASPDAGPDLHPDAGQDATAVAGPDEGPADRADAAEEPDSVVPDRSDRTPVGPVIVDHGLPVPGHHLMEGSR